MEHVLCGAENIVFYSHVEQDMISISRRLDLKSHFKESYRTRSTLLKNSIV